MLGQDEVDRLAPALVGRDSVAQWHVDDGVPGAGREGEQPREPVQPVMVTQQQTDGVGGAQGGVAQGLPGLDDPVLVRAGPGPELAQSQAHAGILGAGWVMPPA